jgi:hypothetical protein
MPSAAQAATKQTILDGAAIILISHDANTEK